MGDGELDIVQRNAVVDDPGSRFRHPVGDHDVGRQVAGGPAAPEQNSGEERGVETAQRGGHQREVRRLLGPTERFDGVGIEARVGP